ncbi:MAG: hypothetical protein U0165_09605 [Polyangiaceae bacterium]
MTSQKARWVISDGEQPQTRGSTLEATLVSQGVDGKSQRIHSSLPAGSSAKPSDADVIGPWKSPAFTAEAPGVECLRLRRVADAWLGEDAPPQPPVGQDGWVVKLEPAQ